MADAVRFWNRISKRYAASPVADEAAYRRKLAETQARFQPDWTVLEMGCGTGNTAIAHAGHVAQVHATDFSEKMLDHGRERAAREGVTNVTFDCKSVAEIGTDIQYDAVLMLSLLHLVPDWRAALDKAWALTRPGGIFVSSTVCADSVPWIARVVLRLGAPLGLLPRVTAFDADALVNEIAARGFEIEERWKPGKGKALFVIARRPASGAAKKAASGAKPRDRSS